jgi:hypothetical protein
MQLQSAKTEIVIASSPVFVIPKSRKRFFPDRGGGTGSFARRYPTLSALITGMLGAISLCVSSTSVPQTTQVWVGARYVLKETGGMKRFLIVVCLAGAIPGWKAAAANSFPWWFHTRPKPVLLDEQPTATAAARNRTPYHWTAASADSGRPNAFDNRRERQARPSKSWLTEFFTRGWRAGAQRSK